MIKFKDFVESIGRSPDQAHRYGLSPDSRGDYSPPGHYSPSPSYDWKPNNSDFGIKSSDLKIDDQVFLNAQNGDKNALDEVLQKVHTLTDRYVKSRSKFYLTNPGYGKLDNDEVDPVIQGLDLDDIVQDVVLIIREKILKKTVNHPRSLFKLVTTIARNELRMRTRASKSRGDIIGKDDFHSPYASFSRGRGVRADVPQPYSGAVKGEEQAALRKAISRLPEKMKRVIQSLTKGKKPAQAANSLGISRANFDQIKKRAIEMLKNDMSNQKMMDHTKITNNYIEIIIESIVEENKMKRTTFLEFAEQREIIDLVENVKVDKQDVLLAQSPEHPDHKQAMDDVLNKTHTLALRFLLSKKLNSHTAEEIAQDIVILVRQKLIDGNPADPETFVPFVFSVARNKLMDHGKGQKHRPSVLGTAGGDDELGDRFSQEVGREKAGGLSSMVGQEEKMALRKAIAMLPDAMRDVMSLVSQGVSPEEGAEQLHINRANFDQIKKRAMAKLPNLMRQLHVMDHTKITGDRIEMIIESMIN